MIFIKNKKQIDVMIEGGKKLAFVLREAKKQAEVGKSLSSLENLISKLIEEQNGKASFKMVSGYRWASCLNINEGVVHGIPDGYKLRKGDLLSIDIGIFYKGFHTDMAETILISDKKDRKKEKFLKAGRKALRSAIKQAKSGNRIGHISQAIQKELKKAGFNPVKNLTGHGVGRELHEDPMIPCFFQGRMENTDLIKDGMVLAIEVIYVQGKPGLVIKEDDWTIETEDGKLSALFEHSVLVRGKEPVVLTALN